MQSLKNPLSLFALAVGSICVIGCMSAPGYGPAGYYPGGYPNGYPTPGGPTGGYVPSGPGSPPAGYPVTGYIPTAPGGPIPYPGPVSPSPGSPNVPTVPVSNPSTPDTPSTVGGGSDSPGSTTVPNNPRDYWVAWPLPPRNQTSAVNSRVAAASVDRDFSRQSHRGHHAGSRHGRPMNSTVRRGSRAAEINHSDAGLPGREPSFAARVSGVPSTPSEDLRYRGGHTIPHLQFVNLYVGGDDAWQKSDIESIDNAIAAAMSDRNLNNVMIQYFQNQPITSTALPSHPLTGYRPKKISQGDVEFGVAYLYDKGYLQGYDFTSTVFNFLLPSGTILTDDTFRTGTIAAAQRPGRLPGQQGFAQLTALDEDGDEGLSAIPHAEEASSLLGLGGYHGSIRKNGSPIYYSVNVYSERGTNGTSNGIPVFNEPWKNVVATLYHELNEARTDPDVEDAIRNPTDPRAERFLGWTSDRGEECGDYPIEEVQQLSTIVREVMLTDGSGYVPVQFQYSNAVHGPEGPITEPHPL